MALGTREILTLGARGISHYDLGGTDAAGLGVGLGAGPGSQLQSGHFSGLAQYMQLPSSQSARQPVS